MNEINLQDVKLTKQMDGRIDKAYETIINLATFSRNLHKDGKTINTITYEGVEMDAPDAAIFEAITTIIGNKQIKKELKK